MTDYADQNPDLRSGSKSGYFEPSKRWKPLCTHPSHNPPMMLYIPPGQVYVHICPSCGNRIEIEGSNIIC